MSNPNFSIFEEITDQNLDEVSAGASTDTWTATLLGTLNCLISWGLGNPGYVCTLTVECQNNCNIAVN